MRPGGHDVALGGEEPVAGALGEHGEIFGLLADFEHFNGIGADARVDVVENTFEHGLGPVWDALSSPLATHALRVTLQVAFITVIANTVFGVGIALLLGRHEFRGKRIEWKLR